MQRKSSAFTRRLPDHVTEELVAVLLKLLESRKTLAKQRSKKAMKDAAQEVKERAIMEIKEEVENICFEPPKRMKGARGGCIEFKQLFDHVYGNLRQRGLASGGEEMLRLRAYEKLQILVARGMVKKTGKTYEALPTLVNALTPPATDTPPSSVASVAK